MCGRARASLQPAALVGFIKCNIFLFFLTILPRLFIFYLKI